jgi:L-amino acid N-acyltransferase YncA
MPEQRTRTADPVVRRVRPTDEESLRRLQRRSRWHAHQTAVSASGQLSLVAERDGHLDGVASATRVDTVTAEVVVTVSVDSSVRVVGTRLLEAMATEARALGVEVLRVDAPADVVPAGPGAAIPCVAQA